MTSQEIQACLERIRNFDLTELGYRFKTTSESMNGVAKIQDIIFENPFLKTDLSIGLWTPDQKPGHITAVYTTTSLAAMMFSRKKHHGELRFDIYCYKHGLPLEKVRKYDDVSPFLDYVDAYLAEFKRASQTYLRDFLLDQAWEVQKDHRDDY